MTTPTPRGHGLCHKAVFHQTEHGFQEVEVRSIVGPVQVGRVLPTIDKFSVHVDPEPLDISQVSATHRLELVRGAPGRNGPQTPHASIETTTFNVHATAVLHAHPGLALIVAPYDLARCRRVYKGLVEAGRES